MRNEELGMPPSHPISDFGFRISDFRFTADGLFLSMLALVLLLGVSPVAAQDSPTVVESPASEVTPTAPDSRSAGTPTDRG